MALSLQSDFAREDAVQVARLMADAARTAPKANGADQLQIAVVDGEELQALARHMIDMHKAGRVPDHFARDAQNLLNSQACLLIGTRVTPAPGRNCQKCLFTQCLNCGHYAGAPCSFAIHDLGVAVGSAASIAADHRMDNRVMYSAAYAALDLGWLGESVQYAMALPLSVSGKSPFFDRSGRI